MDNQQNSDEQARLAQIASQALDEIVACANDPHAPPQIFRLQEKAKSDDRSVLVGAIVDLMEVCGRAAHGLDFTPSLKNRLHTVASTDADISWLLGSYAQCVDLSSINPSLSGADLEAATHTLIDLLGSLDV